MAEAGSGRMDYADAPRIAAHVSLFLGVARKCRFIVRVKNCVIPASWSLLQRARDSRNFLPINKVVTDKNILDLRSDTNLAGSFGSVRYKDMIP